MAEKYSVILNKYGAKVWTGFSWLEIRFNDSVMYIFGFHKSGEVLELLVVKTLHHI
jgi:hypothetical protein